MIKQSMALTKFSTATWDATFSKARQVYTAVVCPAMTYGSTVWQMPKDTKNSTKKLSFVQNRCLRTVAGAFKATPILVLEAETYIAPIDVHLDQLQARPDIVCVWEDSQKNAKTCKTIANKLQGKAGRKRVQQPTPGEQKHDWAPKLLSDTSTVSLPNLHRPWSEAPLSHRNNMEEARAVQRKHFQQMRE